MSKHVDAGQGEQGLASLFGVLDEMMSHYQWVFDQTDPHIVTTVDIEPVSEEIYVRDKRINALERKMRYEVLRHLTSHPEPQVSIGMMLVVVSKDAEAIGDYCKNIFEVLLYVGPSRYAVGACGRVSENPQAGGRSDDSRATCV